MAKCLSHVNATNIRMEAHINTWAKTVATSDTFFEIQSEKKSLHMYLCMNMLIAISNKSGHDQGRARWNKASWARKSVTLASRFVW